MGDENTPDIILRLADYLGQGDFASHIEAFLDEYATKVKAGPSSEEHDHESHDIHLKFIALTEKLLEGFVKEEGLSNEEFKAICSEAQSRDEVSANFLEALIASWEYPTFLSLAHDYAEEMKEREEKGEEEDGEESEND
uniref:Cilia- and flagella-associated protein 36 n=1 Tax=Palpitomonas bilix TaxID=652834 RepID=A0A7S3DCL9_9EUKA|mmetsp:Transcript_31187/g.81825  ORF Transcript_31187/g.81825 Transcript_31187/m.81825 type:complete len:139 (+) Transcript_31187:47-463(+)